MWVKNGPFSEKNPKNAEQDNKWLIYGFSLNTRFIRNVLYCNKIQHQSARGQGVATSCVCDAEKSHCFFASLGLFVLFLCDPHESLKTQINILGWERLGVVVSAVGGGAVSLAGLRRGEAGD